ncbi:MAG: hypothetical protein AAGD43_00515 [Pseudomonadota bacterium]
MAETEKAKTTVVIDKRLVFINSASSILARLLNVFVLVWLYQYLLTRLPPDEFAIYPVVAAVMVFAPVFSSLFKTGVSRFVIEAYARSDVDQVVRIVSSILPVIVLVSAVFLALGLAFSWHIDHVLTVPAGQTWDAGLMLGLLVTSFTLRMMLLPYSVGFHVRQRFVLLNLIEIGRDVLRMVLLLGLLILVSPRVLWVVVATVGADVVSLVLIAVLSRRMLPILRFNWSAFQWALARKLMSFGGWSSIGQIANMLYVGSGAIVLNKLGTPLDVTNYHLGSVFNRQLQSVVTLAAVPVQPALTAMHATDEVRRLGNAYLRGGRYALWATMIVATPLIIFSDVLINLYVGDNFMDAAVVITFLLASYPILQANAMLPRIATAIGRIGLFVSGSLAVNIISLVIMIALVGQYQLGAVGVAATMFASVVLSHSLFFVPLGLRLADVRVAQFVASTIVPGLMPAIAATAVLLIYRLFVTPESWLLVGIGVAVGGGTYLVALLLFCLQPDEKRKLGELFTRMALRTRR